mgnify:CR=1 FL=1
MNYIEITLTACEPVDQNVEIISAYLSEFGFEGVAEDEIVSNDIGGYTHKTKRRITICPPETVPAINREDS